MRRKYFRYRSCRMILKVSDIIDSRPLSRFQMRTILLGGLVLFADGFDAQTIGFLATPIAESTEYTGRRTSAPFSPPASSA